MVCYMVHTWPRFTQHLPAWWGFITAEESLIIWRTHLRKSLPFRNFLKHMLRFSNKNFFSEGFPSLDGHIWQENLQLCWVVKERSLMKVKATETVQKESWRKRYCIVHAHLQGECSPQLERTNDKWMELKAPSVEHSRCSFGSLICFWET